jgi:hypothetical protein
VDLNKNGSSPGALGGEVWACCAALNGNVQKTRDRNTNLRGNPKFMNLSAAQIKADDRVDASHVL